MKKRLLLLIIAVVALVIAGSALIACSGAETVNADGMVVTKEQWETAFATDSFASNIRAQSTAVVAQGDDKITYEYVVTVGSEKYGSYSKVSTYKLNGERQRESKEIRINGSKSDTFYYQSTYLEDGKWEFPDWEVEQREHVAYTESMWNNRALGEVGLVYAGKFLEQYDNFKLEDGRYVLKSDGFILDEEITIADDNAYTITVTVTATAAKISFSNYKVSYMEIDALSRYEMKYNDEAQSENDYVQEQTGKTYISIEYRMQTISAPYVPSSFEWDTTINGTYYSYQDNEYNYDHYIKISDGKITASDYTSATIETIGTYICVTLEKEEDGVSVQRICKGIIVDGIINFTDIHNYKDGEFVGEQWDAKECFRKDDTHEA